MSDQERIAAFKQDLGELMKKYRIQFDVMLQVTAIPDEVPKEEAVKTV